MTGPGLRLLAVLLLAVLITVGGSAPVSAQAAPGVIAGQVSNGTAGGAVPADVDVTVHILTNRQKTGEQRVRTDGAGRYRLEGLASGPEMMYFAVVEYRGVAYFPDRPLIFQDAALLQADITVYDASPVGDTLSFDRLNMLVVSVSPTAMTIMEMGSVINASDKTFAADPQVTGSGRTLRFQLPPGATQITPQAGLPQESLEPTTDGFATTDPVKPGRREIAFSYELPYQRSSLDLARRFAFPVGAFTVYLPGEEIQLVGPGLMVGSTADLGGRTFRRYEIENVNPGDEVRFRLSGLPAPLLGNPRDLGLAVAGAASVALAAFLLFAVRRRRQAVVQPSVPGPVGDDSSGPRVVSERQALLRAVAELDEGYASGALDEDSYRTLREQQKARLVALSRATADA